MRVHLVRIHVKPESIEAFKEATLANAKGSIQEPGIAHFDFYQEYDDPNRFVLIEAFYTDDAPAAHKETAHYQIWRETVEPMMAGPRSAVRMTDVPRPNAISLNPTSEVTSQPAQ